MLDFSLSVVYSKSVNVDWDLEAFVRENVDDSEEAVTAIQLLAVEYDDDGANEKFRSVMQGTVCTMGSASQRTMRMYKALGLGTVPLGGTIGSLDCHLGGIEGSCSESAACISWNSRSTDSASSSFLIRSLDRTCQNDEIVTYHRLTHFCLLLLTKMMPSAKPAPPQTF